jgi:hypothetical protein
LCVLEGVRGACPHHAHAGGGTCWDGEDDSAEALSPLHDEWVTYAEDSHHGERRTLTGDEALDLLDRIQISTERVEIEHRWVG